MTFDIDFVKIPYWFWGCLGAGSLWVVKAWADKRYQARTEPQTRQQIDDDERSLTNRILHSEQFKEAADHQVNITMMSEKHFCAVEGIFLSSMKISDGVRSKIRDEINSQVGEKITGMGDTQRVMLESLKDIKKSLDDLKLSSVELKTRFDEHIKRDE